ncbi:MAG: DUF5671 domain-containing protein [Candidatus Limnocylindria bacterium]|nr:DUF5671 domain-containing protein [Candidatus Limnocylindria bacterium]
MFFGIVISVAVVGALVLAIGLFVQRGREGVDLSPRSLLRIYLYVASLAGVIVAAGGLAALLTVGLAATPLGRDTIYGGQSRFAMPAPVEKCPPGVPCPEAPKPEEQQRQIAAQQERLAGEDLIRGVTFTIFGAIFLGAHWAARRALAIDERRSLLRRAYLMLGTLAFGLATIGLLPNGVTTAAQNALLVASPGMYRQPAGEPLAGGIVALVIWLVYLRLVVRDFRHSDA